MPVRNNNIWNDDGSGSACTYVTDDPKPNSNAFDVQWQWSGDPIVRGFPNVGLRTKALPVHVRDLRSLNISAAWTLTPSSSGSDVSADDTSEPDGNALEDIGVETNVCLDVFADSDEARSLDFGDQKYEIMVWFAAFGGGAKPVGNTTPLSPPVVSMIQGTEFTLYSGTNTNGQTVLTWVANRTLTTFDIDVAPLFGLLASKGLLPEEVYLGTVQFGTETFAAAEMVIFNVTSFNASIRTVQTERGLGNATNSQSGGATTTDSGGLPIATQVDATSGSARQHSFLSITIVGITSILAAMMT
ncbi:Endoglucanase cel12A [Pseudocercospora fuligena]|uniref:Endoglucanase cel12A n=1 Tax=Pseudocercospora fuligena TaxID=685502 RepID=A0A8H6RIN4_9PEZI|nr:Endoglucanase cel12A [Pseudocercospora fuligena]